MTEATAPADESSLLENQVTELYKNSTLANLAILAIALFLGWILWPVADHDALLAWYGYMLVIALANMSIARQYKIAKELPPDPTLWLNLHSTGVFLAGLGWGVVLLFIVPVEARFHLVSAVFVISGLATASAGSMASLKHGFAVFSIPALLPGALKLLWINEAETVLLGCFICAFLIFIAMVALRIHEVILQSLRKQFESTKFVVEVQAIHEALIARYDDLERQLRASTKKIAELQAALEQKSTEITTIAEAAERRSKSDRSNVLLDKLHGGAWDYNLKSGEIRFSSQWLNMLGYKEDEVYSTMDFWKSLLHPDEKAEVLENLHAHISGKIPKYFSSHRLRARSGEWMWVFSRGQPVAWDQFGQVLTMVCVEIDIEDPETYLAGKLTSVNFNASEWLHSETMFMQRLQYALLTTSIENVTHALCHIRVDAPDLPADGNALPGNEIPKQLASVLIKECRHEEPVLDLGNNSFAVLLENHSIDKALHKTATLQKCIDSHQFGTGGQRFCVNTYIGITPIFDTHKTISEIFDDAETACNIASSDSQESIFVFQRGNVEYDSGTFEKRIFGKIRKLLADKRLDLTASSLKPLTSLSGNPVRISWLAATLPGLKNYAFAVTERHDSEENNSLAVAFDLCAIEMFRDWALAQPKSYTEQQNVYVFECKLSSILDEGFVSRVRQLYENNIPVKYFLCIAIPEAVFIAHDDKVRALIDVLKPAGVKFALTDFGAGSFSYDYLKNLPVDLLKLHDSLIASIDTDKTSVLTVKYFNEIGLALNFKTIAFCSDSERQEAALHKIGTHYIRNSAPDSHNLNAGNASAGIKPFLANGHDLNSRTSLPE